MIAEIVCFVMHAGHPFMDGNKRTAFFLVDQYLRAIHPSRMGFGRKYNLISLADQYISAASAQQDVNGLAAAMGSLTYRDL